MIYSYICLIGRTQHMKADQVTRPFSANRRETWRHIVVAINVLWLHSKGKNCELVLQTPVVLWMKSWWVHSVFNCAEAIWQTRSVHWSVVHEKQFWLAKGGFNFVHVPTLASSLLYLVFLIVALGILYRILYRTFSMSHDHHAWASVAVRIISLLNARNFNHSH